MLLSFPLFLFAILFTMYLPGRFLVRRTGYVQKTVLSTAVVSLGVGVCLYIFIQYLFSWIHLELFSDILLIMIGISEMKNSLTEARRIRWSSFFSIEVLIIILGTLFMSLQVATSGIPVNGQMYFYAANSVDSIYHIAIIESLMRAFPPFNPSLSGVPLRGYHFLYDFLIAQTALATHISVLDLFFRYFTASISLFYGLAGWIFADFLKLKKNAKYFFLFLLYFAQGFQFFLLHPFSGRDMSYDSGIIQSLVNIFNPSVVISVALFFVFFVLFFSIQKKWQILLPALILGIVTGIKIYTAVLIYFSSLPIILYTIYKKKFISFFVICFSSLISAAVYLPFNYGAGGLVLAPLLLYRHFMEGSIAFSDMHWGLQYTIFAEHHNIPHIMYLYIVALLLFFIPTLGIRLFALVGFPVLLRKSWYNNQKIFLTFFIVFSVILSSFFIQSVGIFNSIQFLWIGYILLCLPTAIILGKIASKNSFVRWIVIVVLFISVIPDTLMSFQSTFRNPLILGGDFLTFTKEIQTKVPKKDVIMVLDRDNGNDLYATMRFAAFTDRFIYYEPEVTDFTNTYNVIPKRRAVIDTIQNSIARCDGATYFEVKKIIQKNGIHYIVFLHKPCGLKQNQLRKVLEKGQYSLYSL